MKRFFYVFTLVAAFLLVSAGMKAQTFDPNAVDGRIYFKIKDNASMDFPVKFGVVSPENISFMRGMKDKYNITSMRNTFWQTTDARLHRVFMVDFADFAEIDQFIKELSEQTDVEFAEKAPFFRISFTPNDANYNSAAANRWHLDKISAVQAWDINQGNANIKVAVIDNAIDIDHVDLAGKVVLAIDLGDGDADPSPPSVSTIWSHGTHTSGLVGCATNNSIGAASIGFNVSLICVKAGRDADGGQGVSAMYEGITWSADNGADVISMSFGGPSYFITMQMIIDYAYNKGCVLVAAAGNNGDGAEDPNNVNYVGYPAACNHVISVGATNGNDKAASFSEFGTWIDVMAPGGYQNDGGLMDIIQNKSVYSLTANNAYGKMQGTSMACPIAAGLCGLMLSVDSNMSPDRVTELLKATCTDIESLQDVAHQGMVGAGRINAFAALTMVQDSMQTVYANFSCSGNFINAGGVVNFTDLSVGTPTSWAWEFPGGSPATSTMQNPTGILYDTPGVYEVTLTISDGTNSATETKVQFITVQAPANSAWIEQATGFASMYRGVTEISIVSPDIVWVIANDGTTGAAVKEFSRTIDGGSTWTPGTITATGSLGPANIVGLSADTAIVAMYPTTGAGGEVFKTTDAGLTWVQLTTTAMFSNSASFINIVHFFNQNEGYCMGDPISLEFEIYYTSDGGVTWTQTPAANIPDALSGEMGWTGVYDAYGDVTWFGTNKGRIFKSVDKGITWTLQTPGFTDVSKITFNNENSGIAQQVVYNTSTGAITSLTMKKTIDGGANWVDVTPSGSFWKSDIAAVPGVPGKFYSVGTDGAASTAASYGSSFSLDYGANWTEIDTGVQYISVCFYDDIIGWAGGFSLNPTTSGIFKWDASMGNENIMYKQSMQVFPNPAENIVFIRTETDLVNAEVNVLDMMGRTVISKTINSNGSEPASIGIDNLHPGLYILTVQGENLNYSTKLIVK